MKTDDVLVANCDVESFQDIESYFNEYWYTGVSSPEPVHISGKRLTKSVLEQRNVRAVLDYVSRLVNAALDWERDEADFSSKEEKEAVWYGDDGICMYSSVLLYYLLLKEGSFRENQLHYFQGCYEYIGKDPLLDAFFDNQETIYRGPHAWLVLGGSVIDLSIASQKQHFDLKGKSRLLGVVPAGMNFYGCEEPKEIIEKYGIWFSRRMDMGLEEWIRFHEQNVLHGMSFK